MDKDYIFEKPLGYQQITSLSAATALTIPTGTQLLIATAEGQTVRWRDDGTDPTASVGYPLPTGAELQYTSRRADKLKFIEATAGATLNITYYG